MDALGIHPFALVIEVDRVVLRLDSSAINPLASSYELEHYFAIAEPNVIAVDRSQLNTVQTALERMKNNPGPRLIVIDDGSAGSSSEQVPVVR